jgi:pyruvyltransferase
VSNILKAFYWNPTNNFGDMLSPVVLEWISGQKVKRVPRNAEGKFLVIGSILRALQKNDIVWGAGSMYDEPLPLPSGVKILAIRGPLTRECFIKGGKNSESIPEVYGDPALLMPKIYKPVKVGVRFDIGIILNEVDKPYFKLNQTSSKIKLININDPWRKIINLICACDSIISSSLHGIIVAEAYGIPAIWIKVTDKVKGNGFKFQDYFLSTGRDYQAPVIWDVNINKAAKNILPKPIINTEKLEKAFKI